MVFLTSDKNGKEFMKAFPEIQALSSLDHPNIVKYYTCWMEEINENNPVCSLDIAKTLEQNSHNLSDSVSSKAETISKVFCIQMEYCGGNTLSNWMEKRSKRKTQQKIFNVFHEIALGLAHIHAAGIVHRDLKSIN